jgi:hypothetical protein
MERCGVVLGTSSTSAAFKDLVPTLVADDSTARVEQESSDESK